MSIPDDVFARADRLAKQLQTSRSDLYSRALAEYIARHDPDEVTSALNRVAAKVDTHLDPAMRKAAHRRLRSTEW